MPIRKKSNMLVRSIKPSERARKCIALSSTESAKRQKSKAKPKLPSSQHSSATPSTQKCHNPISLPISTINNSTPNPQYGGFLHPTPSSSGEHLQEPITVMGSWHLKVPLPSCGSSIFATTGTGLASNRRNSTKLATWRFCALIIL